MTHRPVSGPKKEQTSSARIMFCFLLRFVGYLAVPTEKFALTYLLSALILLLLLFFPFLRLECALVLMLVCVFCFIFLLFPTCTLQFTRKHTFICAIPRCSPLHWRRWHPNSFTCKIGNHTSQTSSSSSSGLQNMNGVRRRLIGHIEYSSEQDETA